MLRLPANAEHAMKTGTDVGHAKISAAPVGLVNLQFQPAVETAGYSQFVPAGRKTGKAVGAFVCGYLDLKYSSAAILALAQS